MKDLNLHNISKLDRLEIPVARRPGISLDSPAVDAMLDLLNEHPPAVSPNLAANDAHTLLANLATNLALVLDADMDLVGLINTECMSNLKMERLLAQRDGAATIRVSDLMLPREKIKAISCAALNDARTSDIIRVMKTAGQQYCFVVDKAARRIIGLFSLDNLAARLNTTIAVDHSAGNTRGRNRLH